MKKLNRRKFLGLAGKSLIAGVVASGIKTPRENVFTELPVVFLEDVAPVHVLPWNLMCWEATYVNGWLNHPLERQYKTETTKLNHLGVFGDGSVALAGYCLKAKKWLVSRQSRFKHLRYFSNPKELNEECRKFKDVL